MKDYFLESELVKVPAPVRPVQMYRTRGRGVGQECPGNHLTEGAGTCLIQVMLYS